VQDAGEAIFEAVGRKILTNLGLNDPIWLSRLKKGLSVACLCHDLGKANDGFQKMIRGQISPNAQPIRHELLSALLLVEEGEVRQWVLDLLSENEQFDDANVLLDCVIAAVGGHHRKLDEEWKKASIALHNGGCGEKVEILLGHDDLRPLFGDRVCNNIVINLMPTDENSLEDRRIEFHISSNRFQQRLNSCPKWCRFAAALKVLTAAADVAGSALPEQRISPRKWVKANLAESQFVSARDMRKVVRARLGRNTLRNFQRTVANSTANVTLVEAGCGTGKTLAAYLWAERHAQGGKLFFCYPTTGTATEGFLGYVAENHIEAELIHSRAAVDIEEMTEVRGDDDYSETEKHSRIESLKMWHPKVVVCTADTILSLVRNNRRGWYSSPAILCGTFVFDELHAYDNRMFAAVIALIKAMPNAHFLLMTASLPQARKKFLCRLIPGIAQIETEREFEELPRYHFQKLADEREAFEIARRVENEQLKILWICNTVARAQGIYDELKAANLPVQTYHSRFKYEDRKEIHRKVVDGFKRKTPNESLIAVTTQVAEMSLDLDADILISELAPVPSLIQRLGRLNRRITPENPGVPRNAYFYMPANRSPYGTNDEEARRLFEQAESWLGKLIDLNGSRPLSQADLAEQFQNLPQIDEERLDDRALRTALLDSGFFATPEPVREPDISISVIMEEDTDVCRQEPKQIIRKSIPMTFDARKMKGWRKFKSNLIAPPNTIDYCKDRGARWL
jgi:CRISPR-associated endonuclease/helicase Cas3